MLCICCKPLGPVGDYLRRGQELHAVRPWYCRIDGFTYITTGNEPMPCAETCAQALAP